jgi:hypothetical protein
MEWHMTMRGAEFRLRPVLPIAGSDFGRPSGQSECVHLIVYEALEVLHGAEKHSVGSGAGQLGKHDSVEMHKQIACEHFQRGNANQVRRVFQERRLAQTPIRPKQITQLPKERPHPCTPRQFTQSPHNR